MLVTAADLASHVNDNTLASAWTANATALKARYNDFFWLPSAGMYRDNDTTTLCPQDANSMAVLYNLTTSQEQAASVSEGLMKNWNDLGPVAPELPDTISPFISGLELQAHFESGNDERAMDLLRREWGYMLYTNLSVQSTLLEGFTANGSLSYVTLPRRPDRPWADYYSPTGIAVTAATTTTPHTRATRTAGALVPPPRSPTTCSASP